MLVTLLVGTYSGQQRLEFQTLYVAQPFFEAVDCSSN